MSGTLKLGNIQANTANAASTFTPMTAFGGFQQTIQVGGVTYICHIFTTTTTWTVTNAGTSGQIEYLIVAGGGGGGMDMGGGGGGGGVVYGTTTVTAGSYGMNIGAGGWGAPAAGTGRPDGGGIQPNQHQFTIPATAGNDSYITGFGIGTVRAYGGGIGGSSYYQYTPGATGGNGGCGGGASGYSDGGTRDGGSGTGGQGYAGGRGGGQYYSGGGGGAGGIGTWSTLYSCGGNGFYSDILGVGYYWGGGGGGSGYSIWGGSGGLGGGGGGAVGTTYGGRGYNNGSPGGGGDVNSQTNKPGGNGGPNTGGGGGGGSHYNSNNKGGDGGSGIIIVRYPITQPEEQKITCLNGSVIAAPGTILQTVYKRVDYPFVYNAPPYNSGGSVGGSPLGELGLTITPKSPTSLLLCRWMINGEMHWDSVFTIVRDGALVNSSNAPGYEGYNAQAGNSPWSGIVTGKYDRGDINSTQNNWFIQYWISAYSTNTTTIYPAIRSANTSDWKTLYLNRTAGSTGQDGHETAVSTGYIMEIAQ